MCRDSDALGAYGLVDETGTRYGERREAALDDVVAVHVKDQVHHARREGRDEGVELLGRVCDLNHLLNDARAVHVERDRDQRGGGTAHLGERVGVREGVGGWG